MPKRKNRVITPISLDLIQKGKWYQPYIHSVKDNYMLAREKYYQGLDIDSAITKANNVTKALFPPLLAFYAAREAEFADIIGVHYDTGENAVNTDFNEKIADFLTDIEQIAKGEMGPGQRYELFSQAEELQASSKKETKKAAAKAGASIKKMSKEQLAKLGGKDTITASAKKQQRTSASEKYVMLISDRIVLAAEAAGVKNLPQKQLTQIINSVLQGKPINPAWSVDVKKVIKKYYELNKAAERFQTGVGRAIDPLKKDSTDKKQTVEQQLAKDMGFFYEDITVEKLQTQLAAATQEAADFATGSLRKHFKVSGKRLTLSVRPTGKKSVVQVQDAEIVIQHRKSKTDFAMGIDIKYSSAGSEKYSRGDNVKYFSELIPLFQSESQATQMMYFLANSFYHNDDAVYHDLVGTSSTGGAGKLYKLINMVRGLYGLLPASKVDFADLTDIKGFVKEDTRFFVLVNQTAVLMTHFLKGVRSVVEAGERGEGANIAGLTSKKDKGLADILNKMNAKSKIKGGRRSGLYKAKLQEITDALGNDEFQRGTDRIYSHLKQYLNTTVHASSLLNEWKFTITNEFIFNKKMGQ